LDSFQTNLFSNPKFQVIFYFHSTSLGATKLKKNNDKDNDTKQKKKSPKVIIHREVIKNLDISSLKKIPIFDYHSNATFLIDSESCFLFPLLCGCFTLHGPHRPVLYKIPDIHWQYIAVATNTMFNIAVITHMIHFDF
jgi:hypothetical protein